MKAKMTPNAHRSVSSVEVSSRSAAAATPGCLRSRSRLVSRSVLASVVGILSLSIVGAAQATGPIVEDRFAKSFELDGGAHREFPVQLLPSTKYTIRAESSQSPVKLRVLRFWNDQKKSDRESSGNNVNWTFESTHHGVRPYIVKVYNQSHHHTNVTLTLSKGHGGGEGHHDDHRQELFPGYSVDIHPLTFESHLNLDSTSEDEYRIHFRANYSTRTGGKQTYEFRKNISGGKGRAYDLAQGSSGAGGLVSNVTLYSNVAEQDTGPGDDPDSMGSGRGTILLERIRWAPGQRSQLFTQELVGFRDRTKAYTLTVQVKITRYTVDKDGKFVSAEPPPNNTQTQTQGSGHTQQTIKGSLRQGPSNPVRQVIPQPRSRQETPQPQRQVVPAQGSFNPFERS